MPDAPRPPLRVLVVDPSQDNADCLALLLRLWAMTCLPCPVRDHHSRRLAGRRPPEKLAAMVPGPAGMPPQGPAVQA